MASRILPDGEFIRLFEKCGPVEMARVLGADIRALHRRRVRIERKLNRVIRAPNHTGMSWQRVGEETHPGTTQIDVRNGVVLVGSDAHYWPGPPSLMHRAFVAFCKEMKPATVIMNGDAVDMASISRFPPIGWEKRPTVQEEIEAASERLHEIEKAAGKARKLWPLGNHDGRFSTRLAQNAPEFAKVKGVHLRDHFPLWEPTWAVRINDDVVVKHRFKGGIHAPHNNVMWAGRTMVTGHLHSAKVVPFTDYNGTRYGVDAGCIADPNHVAFLDYTEANPKNWRSAFCVLTFKDGQLLQPELVTAWDESTVQFRGELWSV